MLCDLILLTFRTKYLDNNLFLKIFLSFTKNINDDLNLKH